METGFWSNVARGLFATIDRALYGLDSILYEILNTIVNEVHLFSNDTIDTFAVRVYTFLGLIMVFKVTFSLINYLVNPDSISDKTNGAGNVAKNIVITLFLIILTPYAFDFLYRAQSAIINDQLVAKVILGDVNTDKAGMKVRMSPGCGNDVAQTSDMGEFIALMTLRPFYQMEEGSIEDGVKTQYCLGGQDGEKIKNLLGSDIYKASKNKIYSINYSFLLSTGAGVVVLLMLLTACMEIALRAIKLGFLEIIAPIPILSYIDPKSGKDGIFKKWLKEVGKTWASLFVRLAAIYFAIYIISLIDEATENISNQNLGIWVSLFILIGALMFAKQFPKLIEDIFGIKLDMLSLHPIKKIQENALGGKILTALPGKVGATAIGAGVSTFGYLKGKSLKSKDLRNSRSIAANEAQKLNELRSKVNSDKAAIRNMKGRLQHLQTNYPEATERIAAEEREIAKRTAQYKENARDWAKQRIVSNTANAELASAEDKYYKATHDGEGNELFSSAHPIMAGVAQTIFAGKTGFDSKDLNSLTQVITAGINAARAAAKRTNDFDRFGYLDRLRDLGTDLTGVKNESGTTSIVKDHLKKQRESLRDIESAIRAQEVRFGNLPEGMIEKHVNANHEFEYKVSETYEQYAPGQKENIQKEIDSWYELRKAQKAIEKENKEYEEVLAINEKK